MGMINMDSLPTTKPAMGNLIPKGRYLAKINKAEMKTPKTGKNDYFSAECNITDPQSGTAMGKFWINLYDSEAALVRFQLGRFITALGLNIQGEFELKDLTKLVNGKSLMVDIAPEERKDGSAPQRSVVDISADCFYPVEKAEETFEEPDAPFMNPMPQMTTPQYTPADMQPAPVQSNY